MAALFRKRMIILPNTLAAFNSKNFKEIAKKEISQISKDLLPLQQGLSLSSYIGPSPFSVIILCNKEEHNVLKVKTGIFYTGIIAGCSCSDDPSPTDEQNEYCEILFTVNKETANTQIQLLDSQ